jgi:hypothetical protein
VLIDGAHNPAAARVLASYILEVFERPLPIVIGAMRDKNIAEMLQALAPSASTFICTAPDLTARGDTGRGCRSGGCPHARRAGDAGDTTSSRPSQSRNRLDRPSSAQARCIWPARFAQN